MTYTTTVICKPLEKQQKTIKEPIHNIINKYGKYKFLWWEFETPLIWSNIILITIWHVIAVYTFFEHPWFKRPGIIIYSLILGGIVGFGITGGAHRYYTHRSFKANLPLRLILMITFTMSGQNSIKEWVLDHRAHHKFSETDADPHNAKRGFFFSHVGWLMMKKHPEVIRRGKTIDISDLYEDPIVRFHQKYFLILKIFLCFIIPTVIPPFLYGETWYTSIIGACFVRYVVSLNSTWAVNSFAHIWGDRPYDRRIFPSENLVVSFFAMGEGYHNYHHTFPWDYRTSELGKYLNATTLWLNIFEKIGWAYDLKTTPPALVDRMAAKHGDGSYKLWGQEVSLKEAEKMK